jgi:leucyl-tRNA synthetase
MFPYPSGEGLHVGHAKTFGGSDVYARFKRLQGYNVLHATGWDAFGLPAEQFAIKMKTNPKIQTKKNTDNFERQMKRIGFSYDWERTVNTTDPEFYKWTQYIFKQLYKAGLCYESFEPINWCPSCKTGLANEDLEDGKCERCGSVVEKKPIRQWVIKITEYAEKLLSGLDEVGWKENIKEMQRNWIGKSQGAEIDFKIVFKTEKYKNAEPGILPIFTTRPDTLFGATYMVLAPEHTWVKMALEKHIGIFENEVEIKKYVSEAKNKSEIERGAEGREKTGVELKGVKAINPANQKEIPVYIADYVLSSYGTGAIMAVPAHDERDFEFAKKFNVEMIEVVNSDKKNEGQIFTESGILVNSGKFDGMESEEAKKKITEFVGGKIVTKYKLRDWVFARQRYWGEPFPIVFDEKHKSYLVADKDLPVKLPDVKNYEPTGDGESPLKNIKNWVEVYGTINKDGEFEECKKKITKEILKKGKIKKFTRETNTMPQWAGSSWYWLRYMDPKNKKALVDKKAEKYWGQVDMYIGGMEHATRHLIYGRFWNRFLYDKKIISTKEPFQRLEAVGLVLGPGGVKMSKRLGNIINPDDICNQFGADTLRTYISFSSSFHDSFSWDEKAIVGSRRFIERVWAMQDKIGVGSDELETVLHQTIKKCEEDFEKMQYNTAIAQMMIFVNTVEKVGAISLLEYINFLKILSPVAPFVVAEIFENLQKNYKKEIVQHNKENKRSQINFTDWPAWDAKKIQSKVVNIALQVNGKLRDTFTCAADSSDDEIKKLAEQTEGYKKWVTGQVVRKVIVIKNKVINIVV